MAGILYLVATPIGNLEDMTFRAIRVLKEADLILAEDTRTTGILLKHFEIQNKMQSHHKFNEHKTVEQIAARIKGGERHMIMSGEYDKVFPMDILPEFLIKAIIAGDIDRMEALGIYEVAPEDFALCEFVDSSKLELQRIVRAGLDMLRAEMM